MARCGATWALGLGPSGAKKKARSVASSPWACCGSGRLALGCFVYRSCTAAERRANQRALFPADDGTHTGAAGGGPADHHCRLLPRAPAALTLDDHTLLR